MELLGDVQRLRPVLAGIAMLTLFLWYIWYFRVMQPRRGTFEWIERVDRQRFSPAACCPIRGTAWLAALTAAVLGAADCLLRMRAVYAASLVYAGLAALGAALFCVLLLQLYGDAVAAVCGTTLLLAAGMPPLEVLAGLWLFFLFLTQSGWLRILTLVLSMACLSGIPAVQALLLLAGYCVLYLVWHVLLRKERDRHPMLAVPELLLILALAAVSLVGGAFLSGRLTGPVGTWPAILLPPESVAVVWPERVNLPMLLAGSAALVDLVQAARLRDSRCLLGGVMGLICLPLLLLGAETAAYMGCALAIPATFAAAGQRGAKWPMGAATFLLFFCILCS